MRRSWVTIGAALALAVSTFVPALAADSLRVGATFITSGLDPTKGSNGWALVSEGIGENLYTVDKDGRLQPQLAENVTRLDDLDWEVTLKSGRKFSDGSPVDADAVSEALNHTFAANKTALATGGMLTFTPAGPLTLKVKTGKPVAAIASLFAEWPMIVYHLEPDGTASFSGPYKVAGFKPDASLDLVANPYYPGAGKRSPVQLQKFGDAQAMALAFQAHDLDLAFGLPVESLAGIKSDPVLSVKAFPVAYQYMALINTRRPGMEDVAVRRAIDLAIDRAQLVAAIDGGLPATGAFASYFSFADKTPRPTDLAAARTMLDQAGWIAGADGMRAKDGQKLQAKILAYPQRPDLVTMQPVVKAELQALGMHVDTAIVNDASGAAAGGDFDLLLWAQNTAPSGDPAFFFNSMLRSGAALNYTGYSNPALDKILDEFAGAADPKRRAELAAQADAIVFKDAPISYLVTPDWYVGLSKRLAGYQPWGSDYHVLRDDIGATD